MAPHEKQKPTWQDGTPGVFLGLRGLGQEIKRVVIELAHYGAPPVKPEVIVLGKEANDPLYDNLYNSVIGITSVMSETGWDAGVMGQDNPTFDSALESFNEIARTIDKERGRKEAEKMLNTATEEVGRSAFFRDLQDAKNKKEQLKRTLHFHFQQLFDTTQANSLR